MMKWLKRFSIIHAILALMAIGLLISITPARAAGPTNQELLDRIETLEQELLWLKQQVQQNNQRSKQAEEKASVAQAKAEAVSKTAEAASGKTYLETLPDTIWHLAGYATVGAEFKTKADENTFSSGKFNPAFHFQYKDILIFEGELEFEINEDGETEFELEYTQLDFLVHDNITLVVGKYLSPVGQFQERLHPNWINKFSNAPAGFGHDGAQPGSEVGVQVRGGILIGKKSTFTYVLATGNGPRMGEEGNVEFEGFGADNNNNKAFGGRVAFLPVPYLEVGASYWKGMVDGLEGPGALMPTSAYAKVYGLDAAYTRGPWDVRFEYLKNTRDPINSFDAEDEEVVMMPKLTLTAWYAQISYRLSKIGDSPFLRKLEPAFRFGKFTVVGNHHLEEQAQKRINIGLNYWIAPSAVARIGIEWRDFIDEEEIDETLIQLQVSYGF